MVGRNVVRVIITGMMIGLPGVAGGAQKSPIPGAQYTLEQVIALALQHNPAVARDQGRIQEGEGQQITASSYPNPKLNIQSGPGSVRDPSNDRSLTERYFTLQQQLEWPGKRAARQKAADAGIAGAWAGLEETKLNLTADVKLAFYALLLVEQKNTLAEKNLVTVKRLANAVQARVKSGEAAPFELLKVKVEILKAQQELARAQANGRSVRVGLNHLTGRTLGSDYTTVGDFRSWPGHLRLPTLIDKAIEQHPALIRAKHLVEQADFHVARERHARVPDVTLNGTYQRDAGHEAVLGGLSVALPLWSRREGDIAQALARKHQLEAEMRQSRNNIQKSVTESFKHSQAAVAQIKAYEEGLLKETQEAMRIAHVSFQFGEASLLEVLDAQRVFWHTLLSYGQARYDLSVALTELERSSGGL